MGRYGKRFSGFADGSESVGSEVVMSDVEGYGRIFEFFGDFFSLLAMIFGFGILVFSVVVLCFLFLLISMIVGLVRKRVDAVVMSLCSFGFFVFGYFSEIWFFWLLGFVTLIISLYFAVRKKKMNQKEV